MVPLIYILGDVILWSDLIYRSVSLENNVITMIKKLFEQYVNYILIHYIELDNVLTISVANTQNICQSTKHNLIKKKSKII